MSAPVKLGRPRGAKPAEPERYVFVACRACRRLKLIFKGPADKARAAYRKASMQDEVVFFESQLYAAVCKC